MSFSAKNTNFNIPAIKNIQRLFLFIYFAIGLILFVFYQLVEPEASHFIWLKYFIILLLFILLTGFILLRFLLKKIKKEVKGLMVSRDNVIKISTDLEKRYNVIEASYNEIQGLDNAINNAVLYASVSQDGSVQFISKKFSGLLGLQILDKNRPFEELLSLNEGEQQTIHELLKGKRQSIWVGEVQVTTKSNEKLWLEMSVIPLNQEKKERSVLVLCTDISKRIASQMEMDAMNKDRFIKEVSLQKNQASQIVEAQEEERKRIAKDIHDGIGQMLTALKFNTESINISNTKSTIAKVERLKELLSSLIKEVRTVTFNLTPPELSDFGIVPTLNKLAIKLSGFTGKKVLFENKTNFKGRFDSLVETNLYRVVQESVNNALKYADSNYILIAISHSDEKLSIVIDDDGKGFDSKYLMNKSKESGMGLFFMKERISYINGRLFINSVKDKGTRVTINLNLS